MNSRRLLLSLLILSLLTLATPGLAREDWDFPVSREVMEDPQGFLILVNNYNLLTREDVPEDLVNITVRMTSSTKRQMRRVASDAMTLMFEHAASDGVTLYAHSCYRDYRTQEVMHYNRVKKMGYDDKLVIQAGASDHQTGLGVDVISKAWIDKSLNYRFADTKEGQWLAENCARYGFIIRYPKGKEDITEIDYEPWHLRFVGIEAALYMTEAGLTLEEFTEAWEAFRDSDAYSESARVLNDEDATWTVVPVTEVP